MDLEKRYFNGDGDPCDILEVIKESSNQGIADAMANQWG